MRLLCRQQSRNDEPITTAVMGIGKLPGQAVVVVIAGIAAAWIAAGSTGFLGHSLRHALTCLALGIAILAAWPWPIRTWKNWAILAAGIAVSLILNSSVAPNCQCFRCGIATGNACLSSRRTDQSRYSHNCIGRNDSGRVPIG